MVAKKVWFEGERIYIETDDGRTLWQSILYYQRLRNATKEQREDYELGAFGIHWEEIDEDVSYESFEYDDPEPAGISRLFLTHPEINASAVARCSRVCWHSIYGELNVPQKNGSRRY